MAPSANLASDGCLLTGAEAVKAIQSGTLTVHNYVVSLLHRIDERDHLVKAWQYIDREYVLSQAKELDAVPFFKRGPLHGLAVGVKDVVYTKDMPTQYNSAAYKNDFPKVDASSISMLRQAGALILGKTTTTEFAATDVGPPTRNPHDFSRTPGGSSAGSGAAVGDFHVPVALGTQTGGSTIRPASYNGVYGFKPTWGCISREGTKFFSVTFDTLGFFSRSVDDLNLLADGFSLRDDNPSPFFSLHGSKFALMRTMMWPAAEDSSRKALDRAVELLRANGAEVEEVELPSEFDKLPHWYDIVLASEGATAFLPEYRASRQLLGALLVDYVENKAGYTRRQYLDALDNIAALRPKIDALLKPYTAVITPSVTEEAPVGVATGSYAFCKIWTGLHVPVVNVPGFKGPNGMPIGISLVAPRYHDRHLLTVAAGVGKLFEAEGGWKRIAHGKANIDGCHTGCSSSHVDAATHTC